MKKVILWSIALATLLAAASCAKEKTQDGTPASISITVSIASQTKAFSDGSTVDRLYAGVYEVRGDELHWVADNSDNPAVLSGKTATVSFQGKILLGLSYKVVFWAQKEGAPYNVDWAKNAVTGPTVTAATAGNANDESRDAFYGSYFTDVVTQDINLTQFELNRPFAQVNVLVPNESISAPTATPSSSMTVAQAPTVLNLATGATSALKNWDFSLTPISEAAFDQYANTHKYVAMNYVLVDQTADDPRYDITFSATIGQQGAMDIPVSNAPLHPNCRTNIIGNIFNQEFDINTPITISPGFDSEQILTTAFVSSGKTPENPIVGASGITVFVDVIVNHPIEQDSDTPAITVNPSNIATVFWNLSTGQLGIIMSSKGAAEITLVFPAVGNYTAASVKIYIKAI